MPNAEATLALVAGITMPGGLSLSTLNVPAVLQSDAMQYRLLHKDPYARGSYGYSQWSAALPELLQQRAHAILAQHVAGGVSPPLAVTRDRFRLQLSVDEFLQEFTAPG